MDVSRQIEVSKKSLSQAQRYYADQNYGRSFAHYLVSVQLRPDERPNVEFEFVDVTLKWINSLKGQNRHDHAFTCLQQALELYPQNAALLTGLGGYLMELDQHETALHYINAALQVKKTYIPALKMLESVKNALVARWHFRMLNDTERNMAFKKAIEKKIAQGHNTVLDIGTGTGLMSLFAAKSNYPVKRITACDYSSTMIALATSVLRANDCTINLLHELSTELKISDAFPEKVSLVIAEIIDAGVFGEGIIPTLVHAWDNLLEHYPAGRVIPASVEIHISGLQCPELLRRHQVQTDQIQGLSFDDFHIVNIANEPYDTEDFFCFKNYKCITRPFNPWLVDFNNVSQLRKLLKGDVVNHKLTFSSSGVINAFLLWFKLNLDEDISLETRPCETNRKCCWEQAIFHVDEPFKVFNGQHVHVALSYHDGVFQIKPKKVAGSATLKRFKLSASVVRFLNDEECLLSIFKTTRYLNKKYADNEVSVLDMSPFPYLGLLLAKKHGGSLKCWSQLESDKLFIRQMCEVNDITCDVKFIEHPSDCKNEKFDVIFINPIDITGEVSQYILSDIPLLRRLLKPGGIFLPSCVSLYACVVQSEWFQRVSEVADSNINNFRIAEFVNKYQGTEQLDFTLRHLEYTRLSEPCHLVFLELGNAVTEEINTIVNMDVCTTGSANAICYWFEMNILGSRHSTGPSNGNAFANNAAFLMCPDIPLKQGDCIKIKVTEHCGILRIAIVDNFMGDHL